MRLLAQDISPQQRQFVRDLATGKATVDAVTEVANTDPQQALLLDLTAKYLFTLRFADSIDVGDYRQRLLPILRRRAQLPKKDTEKSVVADQALQAKKAQQAPTKGHGTSRLRLGVGVIAERWYGEIGWRPAYHDLDDPANGFPRSSLQFLNTTLRWYDGNDAPEIGHIDFLRVLALPLRDEWYQPWSWTAGAKLANEPVLPNQQRRLDMIGNAGGGVSWGGEQWLFGVLAEAEVRSTEGNTYDRYDSHYAAGVGGSLECLWQLYPNLGLRAHVRVIDHIFGQQTTDLEAQGAVVLGRGRHWAAHITTGWRHAWALNDFIGQATIKYYW